MATQCATAFEASCVGGVRCEIAVDGHHHQDGPGDVAEGLERDRERGDGGLQPVGAHVVAQPPHQPCVVDLADGVLVGLLSGFARAGLGPGSASDLVLLSSDSAIGRVG